MEKIRGKPKRNDMHRGEVEQPERTANALGMESLRDEVGAILMDHSDGEND